MSLEQMCLLDSLIYVTAKHLRRLKESPYPCSPEEINMTRDRLDGFRAEFEILFDAMNAKTL